MSKEKEVRVEEDAEQQAQESKPLKLKLRKSIQAYTNDSDDPLTELTFREPTGGDIERCGDPLKWDYSGDSPTFTYDERKMTKMLAQLASVPDSAIRKLHPRDWASAALMVSSFFMPDWQAVSS